MFEEKVQIEEEGGYVSNADLFKFINYFRDELTLDNFSVSQLRAMCKLLQVGERQMLDARRIQQIICTGTYAAIVHTGDASPAIAPYAE